MSTLQQFDNVVGRITGISDERDVLQLILDLKELWPKLKAEIEEDRKMLKIMRGKD